METQRLQITAYLFFCLSIVTLIVSYYLYQINLKNPILNTNLVLVDTNFITTHCNDNYDKPIINYLFSTKYIDQTNISTKYFKLKFIRDFIFNQTLIDYHHNKSTIMLYKHSLKLNKPELQFDTKIYFDKSHESGFNILQNNILYRYPTLNNKSEAINWICVLYNHISISFHSSISPRKLLMYQQQHAYPIVPPDAPIFNGRGRERDIESPIFQSHPAISSSHASLMPPTDVARRSPGTDTRGARLSRQPPNHDTHIAQVLHRNQW